MSAILCVFVIIPLLIFISLKLLAFTLNLFIYAFAAFTLAIQFVAKKFLIAAPWIISAGFALAYGLYALGRQIFFNENAKALIMEKLPNQYNPRRRSFSLLIIELMIVKREFISELKISRRV